MSDGLDTSTLPFLPESAQLGHCSWSDWKREIRRIAAARGAAGHLDGTTAEPILLVNLKTESETLSETSPVVGLTTVMTTASLTRTAEYESKLKRWTADDEWIRLLLVWNMSSAAGAGIEQDDKTAAEIWAQLTTRYEASSALERINLVRKLGATKFAVGGDIDEHVAKMCRLWQDARDAGASVPSANFSVHLCNSMPVAFDPVFAHLLGNPDSKMVMARVKALYANSVLRAGVFCDDD